MPDTRLSRHLKDRYISGAELVFIREAEWGGDSFAPGDSVPAEICESRTKLDKYWHRNLVRVRVPVSGDDARTHQGDLYSRDYRSRVAMDLMRHLDDDDESVWTSSGKPRAEVISEMLHYSYSAAERDADWAVVFREKRAEEKLNDG